MISGNRSNFVGVTVVETKIWKSNNVKLVDISIDNDLTFNPCATNTCLKANWKFTVVTKIAKFLSSEDQCFCF